MSVLKKFTQSPIDHDFVQNPYKFYEQIETAGDFFFWNDYERVCARSHRAVSAIYKDKRFGREIPPELRRPIPSHLEDFYQIEKHSMLEKEPPNHTRLRSLVLRAFTTRKISQFNEELDQLCHKLIDEFSEHEVDLLPTYAQKIPIIIIARLLGIPEEMSDQLLSWSNAMVAMYQARRTTEIEKEANQSAADFRVYLKAYIDERRKNPRDDLLSNLIQAEELGEKLTTAELISTVVLLLNAGHEATVHTLGNGIKTLIETRNPRKWTQPDLINKTVEEILRFDPPLHMFNRYAYEDLELFDVKIQYGQEIMLMLAASGRDTIQIENPNIFDPLRKATPHFALGAGIHFCVGAPLARLELQKALPILFKRCPNISIINPPVYANLYHFHGLTSLKIKH